LKHFGTGEVEHKMKKISVAIDGPSGAGKSTVSRAAAQRLGFVYVDTGAIYRTIGLYVMRAGCASDDAEAIERLLPDVKIDIVYKDGVQHMLLCGEDVSEQIRTPEASKYASDVSAVPAVRAALLDMQRSFAEKYDVIMDGRDIGTVVLPDADVKIFLTAAVETRAKRRYDELTAKGERVVFEDVLNDMKLRDYNDSHRRIAPLRRADDAREIDTTGVGFEQAVELVCAAINEVRNVL